MNSTVRKIGTGLVAGALLAGLTGLPASAAPIPVPGGKTIDRLAGADRTATSVAVAEKLKVDKGALVKAYLVGSDAVVDAAVAGALTDGFIIVTPNTAAGRLLLGHTIKGSTLAVTKVVAIGGKGVLSDDAVAEVLKFSGITAPAGRIGGKDRYETAAKINAAAYPGAVSTVFLTRGDLVVDALAAGAITQGPVVLVNPTGAVSDAAKESYTKFSAGGAATVVLGGTGALSDGQVKQLIGEKTIVDPWTYTVTEKELRENVQQAAATFLGQGEWQKGTVGNITDYFGISGSSIVGTNTDPSTVDISKDISTPGDAFMGYQAPLAAMDVAVNKTIAKRSGLVKNLDDAISTATGNKKTAEDMKAIASGADVDGIAAAYVALYGVEPAQPVPAASFTTDKKIDDPGAFVFNAAGVVIGIDKEKAAALTAAAKKSTAKTAKSGTDMPLQQGAKEDDPTALTDGVDGKINWDALTQLVQENREAFKAEHDAAKKNLDDAVAAYKRGPLGTAIQKTPGAVPRLVGADRYETAALLSYYITAEHANKLTVTEVYLVSGNDANLIDSVVAGQLIKGPILLVPSAGELPTNTSYELKRLAKTVSTIAGFVIGGTGAVSDDVVKAAGAAMWK